MWRGTRFLGHWMIGAYWGVGECGALMISGVLGGAVHFFLIAGVVVGAVLWWSIFLVARRTLVFIPGAHFSSRLPIRAVPLLTLFGELLRDSRFLIRAALSFLLIGYSFGECLFDIVCVCVFECAIIYG